MTRTVPARALLKSGGVPADVDGKGMNGRRTGGVDARRARREEEGTEMTIERHWDPASHGVVAHMSAGGFGRYHRIGCADAPARGDGGVRDIIHAPWRYLAAHWAPCPRCRPPRDDAGRAPLAA
ncbi:MAG: hypothetical protein AB1416_05560 [Actinomycetota bacterium]